MSRKDGLDPIVLFKDDVELAEKLEVLRRLLPEDVWAVVCRRFQGLCTRPAMHSFLLQSAAAIRCGRSTTNLSQSLRDSFEQLFCQYAVEVTLPLWRHNGLRSLHTLLKVTQQQCHRCCLVGTTTLLTTHPPRAATE